MWSKFQSETAIFPASFPLRKALVRQAGSCQVWILSTMKYSLYPSLVKSRLCESIQDCISCLPWYYSSFPTACQTLRQIFCLCRRSIIKNPPPSTVSSSSDSYWHRNRNPPFEVEHIFWAQQTFPSQFQPQQFYLSLQKHKLDCSSLFYLTLKNQATEFTSINLLQTWILKYWKNTLWGEVLCSFFVSCLQDMILFSSCRGNRYPSAKKPNKINSISVFFSLIDILDIHGNTAHAHLSICGLLFSQAENIEET